MHVNSTQFIVGMILLAAVTGGIVFGLRWILRRKDWSAHSQRRPGFHLRSRCANADVFRFSSQLKLFGIAVAVAVSLLTINWTIYELPVYEADYSVVLSELVEVVPVTSSPPPRLPPRQIESDNIEIPVENLRPEDYPEVIDTAVTVESRVMDMSAETAILVDPPPLRSIEVDVPEIFLVVEEMPRFRGCEHLEGTRNEKQMCSDEKLLTFIYRYLRYPSMARENGIEGRVVVRFVVDKDGRASDAQIIEDIGGGCGQELLRVVNLMNEGSYAWSPGKQRGEPVRVQFTLPVNFRLTK